MQAIKGIIAASVLMFAFMLTPNSATAGPVTLGEPWGQFFFESPINSFAKVCQNCVPSLVGNSITLDDPPWTFNNTGPDFVYLIVQDAFAVGDQFRVFDFGISIGDTSEPDPDGSANCSADIIQNTNPDFCFTNDDVSKGIFPLAPGSHSVTIQWIDSLNVDGSAFLCVSTTDEECSSVPPPAPVSEPSSLLLLGFALIGAWCWSRREQISKCYVVLSRKRRRR
jgi:hypothetical protein